MYLVWLSCGMFPSFLIQQYLSPCLHLSPIDSFAIDEFAQVFDGFSVRRKCCLS